MANEKRLIYADPVYEELRKSYEELKSIRDTLTQHEDIQICNGQLVVFQEALMCIKNAPTVEVVHGQRLYNAHEVAEILADAFGDTCVCNFNGIDEWLPFKCELQDCCPNTYGVACWEQYLKYRDARTDGDSNG